MSTGRDHPRLREELVGLFARHDPIGLVVIGCPEDEYEPEVERIAARVVEASCAEELQGIIHEVFVAMFDRDIAGPPSRYRQAAVEAWYAVEKLSEDDL